MFVTDVAPRLRSICTSALRKRGLHTVLKSMYVVVAGNIRPVP